MLTIALLGFSSGLPLALTGATLQAWLSDAKIDTATIGRFALIGLPYTVKFLWAPFLDNYALPWLGLRRGWGILAQSGLFVFTVLLACVNPAEHLGLFSLFAFMISFFSASQDIVVDAYRTEVLFKKELGIGVGLNTTGYRLAMLVSGGVALIMADYFSWQLVYICMALINLVGAITLLFSPEPEVERQKHNIRLKDSVISPFLEFFRRQGAMEILLFVMIYKLSTLMATSLTTKFLLDLGYTKTLIGSVNKVAGLIATIAGTLVGGSLMIKVGLKRSLWVFGLIQALVGLTFCLLSRLATVDSIREVGLIAVISLENFMMGLGTAALMGFMMHVCNKQFTGTQYALLTSLTAVTRVILVAQAGVIVEMIGWDLFFILTVPLSIPGLLLLRRFDQWQSLSEGPLKNISQFDLSLIGLFMISMIALSSDPIWRWLGHENTGLLAVKAGALGVLFVIMSGLVKPLFHKNMSQST